MIVFLSTYGFDEMSCQSASFHLRYRLWLEEKSTSVHAKRQGGLSWQLNSITHKPLTQITAVSQWVCTLNIVFDRKGSSVDAVASDGTSSCFSHLFILQKWYIWVKFIASFFTDDFLGRLGSYSWLQNK